MGTILGSAIVAKAARQLLDDAAQPSGGQKRWTTVELNGWLFTAVRELIKEKPDAAVKNVAFTCAAGAKQTVPADCLLLMDVRGDAGTNITPVTLEDMDYSVRGWRTATAGAAVHFMHDARDGQHFYLYPPAVVSATVELVYGCDPLYSDAAVAIPVDDTYEQALMEFVMARAYEKNSKRQVNDKTDQLDRSFYARIGVKGKTQYTYSAGVQNDGAAQ